MHRLICQKPVHFLSAQMAFMSTFFQIFVVLGMYNFGSNIKIHLVRKVGYWGKQESVGMQGQ